ncbi:hypothetical protein [Streptococcus parauberis]|uniref:hypothetical protein n=1 Tax=Streptococcus parauberis TaxID=1348 RepID=UPI000CCF4BA1|nr:hypothetical protein [Streptococcus parauberis]PNY19759.1 hypothetical protein ASN86_00651 [Streptococcus parauberis]
MTILAGCKDSTIPEIRTKKEYQAEQNFKSYFEYLSDNNRNLNNIKEYFFSITISKTENNSVVTSDDYTYWLNHQKGQEFSGSLEYKNSKTDSSSSEIIKQENYPLLYSLKKVTYTDDIPSYRYDSLLLGSIDTTLLREYKIYDFLLKHPETNLKDISYKVPVNSEILTFYIKEFNIKLPKEAFITFTKLGSNEYSYVLKINSESERYMIHEGITLSNTEEFNK